MKYHIGVDAGTGIVHTITATPANIHNICETSKLLRKDGYFAYGDSAYIRIKKRDEIKNDKYFGKTDFRINRRPKRFPRFPIMQLIW